MSGCDIPKDFIDYLLRIKALEASIAVGDDESAKGYFDWLILHKSDATISTTVSSSNCNCRG